MAKTEQKEGWLLFSLTPHLHYYICTCKTSQECASDTRQFACIITSVCLLLRVGVCIFIYMRARAHESICIRVHATTCGYVHMSVIACKCRNWWHRIPLGAVHSLTGVLETKLGSSPGAACAFKHRATSPELNELFFFFLF